MEKMLMIMLNQLFRLKHPSIDRWLPTYCSYCYEDMCLEAGVLLLSNQSRTVCLLTIAEKSQTKPTPNGAKQIDYTVVWPYIRRVTWYWTELETILEANNNETMLSLPMYIYIYIYIYIIYIYIYTYNISQRQCVLTGCCKWFLITPNGNRNIAISI